MGVVQYVELLCTLAFVAFSHGAAASSDFAKPSFAAFIAEHRRSYKAGSQEYEHRHKIFQRSLEHVENHNSNTNRIWTAVVNHLSDRTEAELSQLRGLRVIHAQKRLAGAVQRHGQFLHQIKNSVIPEDVSYVNLKAARADIDQGACGSCWAVATATMLSANSELYGHNRSFTAQELVSCVPNPHKCGGTGGCDGSTAELAMNWVMGEGLATLEEVPYLGVNSECKKKPPASLVAGNGNDKGLQDMIAIGFHGAPSGKSAALQFGLQGWERLPENEYEPLITAVANRGPVAVSVAANKWNAYGSGIYNSCEKDATIDHAVVLLGYGKEPKKGTLYWIIKNSWGLSWGENGNIRLHRSKGNGHCGTDYNPGAGTGCEGGPSKVKVCGMCGILYDSVVPHFVQRQGAPAA